MHHKYMNGMIVNVFNAAKIIDLLQFFFNIKIIRQKSYFEASMAKTNFSIQILNFECLSLARTFGNVYHNHLTK